LAFMVVDDAAIRRRKMVNFAQRLVISDSCCKIAVTLIDRVNERYGL
jgi:hypothetical protein